MQTQYLPQALACLVQPLAEEMEALSLPELTHALKTCFKVLSKVQMPPSYLDMEPASGSWVRAGRSSVVLRAKRSTCLAGSRKSLGLVRPGIKN